MGLAWKTPVADRRLQRDRLAVKNERPVGGPDGRHNLVSTSANAQMRGRCEAYRNVNCPLFQIVRDKFDEFMLQGDLRIHSGRSSFSSRFVSILNWLLFSNFRSR